MPSNWPQIAAYDSPEEYDQVLPNGWRLARIESIFEQLSVGKRFEKKTTLDNGKIPVIDQSESGIIGWHDEAPGIYASQDRPVVTFANHTCEMRWVEHPFSVIQNVFPMIGKDKVCDTRFLYYGTKGRVHLEEYKGHFPDYRRKWIAVPPLAEQQAVASFLGALDTKINLNRQTNKTLEEMARAIFKDWFVDFGPTRAKMEGRSPYLAPEFWNLFPEKFDEEGTPESWTRRPLIDLCQLKRGYDLPTDLRTEGQYPIVSSSGVSGYHAQAMADAPGVVTGRYGTIGQVFFVETDFWPLNTSLYVKDFKGNSRRFVFHTLSGLDFQQYSDKGAVPGINRNDLHQSPVVIPSARIQGAFEDVLSPFWKQATLNESEANTLAQTRDLLLPKLMSGELRVRDAEHVGGQVV